MHAEIHFWRLRTCPSEEVTADNQLAIEGSNHIDSSVALRLIHDHYWNHTSRSQFSIFSTGLLLARSRYLASVSGSASISIFWEINLDCQVHSMRVVSSNPVRAWWPTFPERNYVTMEYLQLIQLWRITPSICCHDYCGNTVDGPKGFR